MEENKEIIELTSQGVGTYWYQPPECFEMGEHPPMISSKVDVWSVGVIFYELLYGQRPFGHGMSQERILKNMTIRKEAREIPFPATPKYSDECKDFIRKCLSYDPSTRYTVEEAHCSPYL